MPPATETAAPAEGAPNAAGAPAGELRQIRVIDSRASTVNLFSLPKEEAEVLLKMVAAEAAETAGAGPAGDAARRLVLAFEDLLTGVRMTRSGSGRPPTRAPGEPLPAESEDIALRYVLNSPGVAPVLEAPPWVGRTNTGRVGPEAAGRLTDEAVGVYVRPAVSKVAVLRPGPGARAGRRGAGQAATQIGLASEEGTRVAALALSARGPRPRFGTTAPWPGRRAALRSGSYTLPRLSAALAESAGQAAARAPPLAAGAGAVLELRGEDAGAALDSLREQIAAAEEYHLSGGDAYLAHFDRAARRADAGAGVPPEFFRGLSVAAPKNLDEPSSLGSVLLARLDAATAPLSRDAPIISRADSRDAADSDQASARVRPFEIGILGALEAAGAMVPGGAFYAALVFGIDSDPVARHVDAAAAQAAAQAAGRARRRRATAQAARARQYALIIEDKFGAARAGEVARALGGLGRTADDPESVLARLSTREREIVETEFASRAAWWEGAAKNTCPHVSAARRMRQARSAAEAENARRSLSQFYAGERGRDSGRGRGRGSGGGSGRGDRVGAEWIACRSCGFRVVCPHVDARIKLEARGASFAEISNRLAIYRAEGRRAEAGDSDSYGYFCRICSEQIGEFVAEDRDAELLGTVGRIGGRLRTLLWSEAIAAVAHVRFTTPVDPQAFAGAAATACLPFLLRAEQRFGAGRRTGAPRTRNAKRRTLLPGESRDILQDDEDEEGASDPRVQLYAAVLAHAYVLRYITARSEALTAAGRAAAAPGYEGVRPGGRGSEIARAILEVLAKERGRLIAQLTDLTPEVLAARLREAFGLLREVETAPGGLPPTLHVLAEIVATDPAYAYAVAMAKSAGTLPLGRPGDPAAARREVEVAIGPGSFEALGATAPLSDLGRILLGLRAGGVGGQRAVVEYPAAILRGSAPEFVPKNPEVNLYVRMFDPGAKKGADARARAAFDALASPAGDGGRHPGADALGLALGGRRSSSPPASASGATRARAAKKGKPEARERHKPRNAKAAEGKKRAAPLVIREARTDGDRLAAAEPAVRWGAYRLFVDYTAHVVDPASLEKYRQNLAAYRDREDGFRLRRVAAAREDRLVLNISGVSPRRLSAADAAASKESDVFDLQGFRHVWGRPLEGPGAGRPPVYVYKATGGAPGNEPADATIELTAADIAAKLRAAASAGEASPLAGMTLVDVRCGVCGVLRSATGALDPAQVSRARALQTTFATFFAYYSVRCPVGDLHVYGDAGSAAVAASAADRCAKCGLTKKVGAAPGAPDNHAEAIEYYKAHVAGYDRDRAELRKWEQGPRRSVAAMSAADVPTPDGKRAWALGWRPDYGVLVAAAELAGEAVPALEAIGATEGRAYSDVLAGSSVDGEPPPPDDPRLLAASSAVYEFISTYNRLRFAARFPKPPAEVVDLLRAAHAPAGSAGDLGVFGGLPPIVGTRTDDASFDASSPADDFPARLEAIARAQGAVVARQFAIETLARLALTVSAAATAPSGSTSAGLPDWAKAVRLEFAPRTLRGIVRGSRLLSKPGRFDFKAAFGHFDISSGQGGRDSDMSAGDVGEAGEADGDAAAGEGHLEEMDVDTPENLE